MSGREDSDSEAPEEFTAEQVLTLFFIIFIPTLILLSIQIKMSTKNLMKQTKAIQKDEELTTIQKENKARYLLLSLYHSDKLCKPLVH